MEIASTLKPALTIEDQLNLLENKGMLIKHTDEEAQFLKNTNYYRLNIYFHKLMDAVDHFPSNISLLDVRNIYQTDAFLRQRIFSLLEPIEIGLKTKLAYYLGNKYGSPAFYRRENFESAHVYDQILNTFLREISRDKTDSVIIHHYSNYNGYFPIWVIVEYLSFTCISNLYGNLKIEDRREFTKKYYNLNEYYFSTWIHSLSVFRNICAHFSYLFNRTYTVPISLGFDSAKYPDQGNKLFGIFYSLKKISPPELWSTFFSEVLDRISDDELINWYNFPGNFKDLNS